MAFNPQEYLQKKQAQAAFNPEAYLQGKLSATIQAKPDPRSTQGRIEAGLTAPQLEEAALQQSRVQSFQEALGGTFVDPETGLDIVTETPAMRMDALNQQQAALQEEALGMEDLANTNPLVSVGAGAATLPLGMVSLAAALKDAGLEGLGVDQSALPQSLSSAPAQRIIDLNNEIAAVNPLAATVGNVGSQMATMGTGTTLSNLLKAQAYRKAATLAAGGGAVNAGVGSAIRAGTGQETNLKDLLLDFGLGALSSGNQPRRMAIDEIPASTVQGAVPLPVGGVLDDIVISEEGLRPIPVGPQPRVVPTPAGGGSLSSALGAVGRSGPVRGVRNVGRRIAINQAEKSAKKTATKALPEAARSAVENGIALPDATFVLETPRGEVPVVQRMTRAAKAYSGNRRLVNDDPALIVGQEFRKRVLAMEKLSEEVNGKLAAIVKDLPKEVSEGAQDAVLDRLGALGITMGEDGLLDFSATALNGPDDAAARQSIQRNFDYVEGKSPLQLHRHRQGLFEGLGGKSKAGIKVVESEEKAINAIRQGLADDLERISPDYKILNQQVAKTIAPLNQIKRLLKDTGEKEEDLLEMTASTLARRITSNAPSGSDISQLLRTMEDRLATHGVTFDTNVGNVQEFYNTLSKYYDIKHSTGLAGQVNLGAPRIELDIKKAAGRKLGAAVSKTEAVQQKFFEELVDSLGSPKASKNKIPGPPVQTYRQKQDLAESLKQQP